MKTAEELNALKDEVETLSKKLAELSEEELTQIAGGMKVVVNDDSSTNWYKTLADLFNKICS